MLGKKLILTNIYKCILGTSWTNWKFKKKLFCQFEQCFLFENLGRVLLPLFNFQVLLYLTLANFKHACHDAMERKSENLAHILGCQTGAVTILPPLQESRPEILGLCEEGGIFLTKASFTLPSRFFFGMVRPLDFEEFYGVNRSAKFFP